jgi:hypothetical protein
VRCLQQRQELRRLWLRLTLLLRQQQQLLLVV